MAMNEKTRNCWTNLLTDYVPTMTKENSREPIRAGALIPSIEKAVVQISSKSYL